MRRVLLTLLGAFTLTAAAVRPAVAPPSPSEQGELEFRRTYGVPQTLGECDQVGTPPLEGESEVLQQQQVLLNRLKRENCLLAWRQRQAELKAEDPDPPAARRSEASAPLVSVFPPPTTSAPHMPSDGLLAPDISAQTRDISNQAQERRSECDAQVAQAEKASAAFARGDSATAQVVMNNLQNGSPEQVLSGNRPTVCDRAREILLEIAAADSSSKAASPWPAWGVYTAVAVGCLALGAAASWLLLRRNASV